MLIIRLKYIGEEEPGKEFWADPSIVEIYPTGYCSEHGYCLDPPYDIKRKGSEFSSGLTETVKSLIAEHRVADCNASLLSPCQQLKPGLRLEIEDENEPRTVWVATITRNVGGRLLMKYVSPATEPIEAWIFCLSPRLHPLGWSSKHNPSWEYRPPKKILQLCGDQWKEMANIFRKEPGDSTLKVGNDVVEHSLVIGTKLSTLAPWQPTQPMEATVIDVIDKHRYAIRFDGLEEKTLCCFAGNNHQEDERSSRSPECCPFSVGMALEVVNPWKASEICVGLVNAVENSLLKIRLQSDGQNPDFYVSRSSFDIYPVGWCESNGFVLKAPAVCLSENSKDAPTNEEQETLSQTAGVSYWCPKIYFNFRCFSGPLLSKVRIAALPRSVGPGPISLVLKEVLSLLVNGAYKPGGVLKQLQGEAGAAIPKGTQLEPLKAKYKQTTYRASIPIASTAADIADYCKWVCEKLQCCPFLFGTDLVGDLCPRKCTILAKVHLQQQKKKAPHWRNKKFVDIMKDLYSEAADVTTIKTPAAPEPVAENSDEEASEGSLPNMTNNNNGCEVNNSSSVVEDEKMEDICKKVKELPEDAAKKKRGRPRKHLKSQHPHVNNEVSVESVPRQPVALLLPQVRILPVQSNPKLWKAKDVWNFMQSTDCACLADQLLHDQIDGMSFMLLNLATAMDYITLDFRMAVRLCYLARCLRQTYHSVYEMST